MLLTHHRRFANMSPSVAAAAIHRTRARAATASSAATTSAGAAATSQRQSGVPISSAIIIVIVALAALLDGASSRVRAAPTETSAALAAAASDTANITAAATAPAATAISEPDPRPAALRRDAGLLAAELAELAAEAAEAAAAVATGGIGGSGVGGGGGGTGTGGTGSAAGNRVDNVTRLHGGDVFNAYDAEACITDTCVGLSSGTAGLFPKNDLNDGRKYRPEAAAAAAAAADCRCQCLPHLTTFREDLNICVDDVHECTLAPFVSGSTSEKIPFVFLPLRGQIIYPSKEISFHGVKSPICAVSGAQYLTTTGWMELRNPIDADVPFRLFRDEGRTFLQWLGEADLRNKMQGRLVLVHLMCRDMSKSTATVHVSPEAPEPGGSSSGSSYATGQSALVAAASNQNIFSPCVAFRVVGQPVKMTNNVTEVSFQPETQTTAITSTIGLSTKEYVAITICSLLLGLIYVASVLLYLYVKKRKSGHLPNGSTSTGSTPGDGAPTTAATINEQVTFGTGFSRSSSLHSGGFGGKIRDGNSFIGDPRRESLRAHQHAAAAAASVAAASSVTSGSSGVASIYGRHGIQSTAGGGLSGVESLGVVKSNPLLKHYPNFDGPAEFPSDLSGSDLECGDDEMQHQHILQRHLQMHQRQMHDMVDGMLGSGGGSAAGAGKKTNSLSYSEGGDEYDNNGAAQAQGGDGTECLPEENISIVEDHLSSDEKLENMKAIVNGTLRRKLYFNPAYFEPHLLMSPPAAAIEFLNKIREVISIAKYKMATKRYQPSLVVIPEEGAGGPHQRPANMLEPLTESEAYQLHGVPRNGMQTPQSQVGRCKSSASSGTGTSCVGCPGCAAHAAADPNAAAGHNNRSDCRNCGDKRNSIRKWLEDVSTHESGHPVGADATDGADADEHNILEKLLDMPLMDALPEAEQRSEKRGRTAEPNSGSDTDTIKANSLDSKKSQKRMAPAPPSPLTAAQPAAPKIITHYLKQDIAKSSDEQQQLEINNNQHNMMRNSKNSAAPFGEAANSNKIYDKMELLTQLTQTAVVGELFNNPQFKHHPPYDPSALNAAPSAVAAKSDYDVMRSLKQHMPDMIYEAMAKDYSKRKIITNQQQQQQQQHHLDHAHLAQHLTIPIQLPHPDYDDNSLSKKFYDDIPAYVHVPTPDYNTYGRSKQNPQPDSPIYKRKSPHHLIVDYETDSLERNSTAHRRHAHGQGTATPLTTPATTLRRPASSGAPTAKSPVSRTDTNTTTGSSSLTSSSEASSQPSPSLSTALPLEEEVEIQHTMVYDRAEGYRKAGDLAGRISFANLLQVQQQQQRPAGRLGLGAPPELPAKQPRIQYNTPSHGSMTIEVEHSPSEYELSTDSEQFEPDTLDRKAARRSSVSSLAGGGSAIVNLWSQHLTKANSEASMRHSSLENISSLPADVIHPAASSQQSGHQPALVLRSSGSFKSNSLSNFAALNVQSGAEPRLQKNFNSLREIYEAKNQHGAVPLVMDATQPTQQQTAIGKGLTSSEREREMGRLLTLEARHSRRQRQTGGTLKKPVPPDVVPNGSAHTHSSANVESAAGTASYYDRPKTPAKPIRPPPTSESHEQSVAPQHYELYQKNLSGWTGNSNSLSAAGNSHSHKTNKSRDSTTTSTSATTTTNTTATTSDDDDAPPHSHHRHGTFETRSNSSESTEVTGVSDTQLTSDSDAMRRRRQQRRAASANATTATATGSVSQQSSVARKYSKVNKSRPASQPPPLPTSAQPQPIEILKNFMSSGVAGGDLSDFSDTSTIKSGSTNFLYQSSARPFAAGGTAPLALAELDQIEIASSKSLSVHSVPLSRDQGDYEHVQGPLPEANNNDSASINHEQLLYDLTSPANHFHYGQPPASQQHAATKVYRCEVNPSSNGMQIAMGLKDRVKKTKDLKYAWKRFVNIATGKFAGSAGNSGSNSPSGTTTKTFTLDDCRLSALSDGDEGISSIHDDSLGLVSSSGGASTAAAKINVSQVSRTPSGSSQRSGRPSVAAAAARHDPDSGYMSADSSESKLNSKRLYERFNFRGSRTGTPTTPAAADLAPGAEADAAAAAGPPKRMQDITEAAGELEVASNVAAQHQKPSVTGFIPKQLTEPIEVNVFSSDDEKFSSDGRDSSDEDDDEEDEDDEDGRSVAGLDDDMCGSGAESVETNSVFFRNVRKAAAPAPPKH